MLKNTIIVVIAILILTLLLSLPSTVAYSRYEKVEPPKPLPETPILQVKLLVSTTTTKAPDNLRTQAIAVKSAIADLESNGKKECTHTPGLSGEKGCYQYLYGTWVAYSTEIYGYVAEQTIENTEYVTEEKIYKWLKAGYSARQIFLIWNSGRPGPCSSGVNSHGVYYNSCQYADRGEALLVTLGS